MPSIEPSHEFQSTSWGAGSCAIWLGCNAASMLGIQLDSQSARAYLPQILWARGWAGRRHYGIQATEAHHPPRCLLVCCSSERCRPPPQTCTLHGLPQGFARCGIRLKQDSHCSLHHAWRHDDSSITSSLPSCILLIGHAHIIAMERTLFAGAERCVCIL